MISYTIRSARPEEAAAIATLIMEAMNHDCCQWFAGPEHALDDFHRLMTELILRTDSQYSYLHTHVAVVDQEVVGVCVAYDGGRLHELRHAFIDGARQSLGMDHSGMDDETSAGEYYIDSLCVAAPYRKQGIASALIKAVVQKARSLGMPSVGLLVDSGNPEAEHLYTQIGFRYLDDNVWGGHPMRHLVMTTQFSGSSISAAQIRKAHKS